MKISPEQIYIKDKERITYLYNAFDNRAHSFYGNAEAEKEKRPIHKHYSADGSVEIKEDKTKGSIDFLFYLGGDPYSAPAVYNSNGEEGKLLFLHRDQLGSIVAITDLNGKLVEARHFDAWGKVLSITDGNGNKLENLLLDRGYTGHEHLASVGLIHMNGRLYDPTLHRFLMPDNYIQDPFNTQSFNRYGYCLNNPLVYNDITGEWFGIDDLIAAVAGGVINLAVNAIQGNVTSWGSALGYFGVGAVSGWASLYVGPLAVGAISGLGNYITTQVSQGGWSSLNFDDGVTATAIGAATSWAGAKIGGWATKNLGGIFSSISSPVLRQAAVNSVGGAVSGFAIGTAVSYIQYKDFDRAFSEGVRGGLMGAGIGLTTGAIGGYRYAKENKLSPWTGEKIQLHHSDPVFMGGAADQELTPMSISRHQELHKDLNNFLVEKKNALGQHMRPQSRNSGLQIRFNFSRTERFDAMKQFYDKNWIKYWDARWDFYKNNNLNLILWWQK